MGEAPHLAPSAAVVADLKGRVFMAGDGAQASVNLHSHVADADGFGAALASVSCREM